jgi:hypothetical protein
MSFPIPEAFGYANEIFAGVGMFLAFCLGVMVGSSL